MTRVPMVLLVFTGACASAGAQETVEVTPACSSVEGDVWESNPWSSADPACGYQAYEGNTTYRFFHDLGREPRSVDLYVSFSADGGSVAPPAGDMARIQGVTDQFVEIRNTVGADFFLRIVLR
ncbi:MAG: hypothetical protein AAF645_18535 [Myxococcota bacterium]